MKKRITLAQQAELSGIALARFQAWKAAQSITGLPDALDLIDLFASWPAAYMGDTVSVDPRSAVSDALVALLDNWDAVTADLPAFRLRVTRLAARLAEPNHRHVAVWPSSRRATGRVVISWDNDVFAEFVDALWAMAKEALAR